MASTIAPLVAWTEGFRVIRKMMPTVDETALQARILDDANKWFWMEDGWRWTTASLNNIALSSSTQDYAYGTTLPTDYLYTHQAYLADGDQMRGLKIASSLPSTAVVVGRPSAICKITGDNFRVWPKPGVLSNTNALVQIYKKTAPTITSLNVNTGGTLVFDDEWFPVYLEIVIWYLMRYAYDDRAGAAQVEDGKIVYAGQLGLIKSMIAEMRRRDTLTPNLDTRMVEPPTVKK